MPLKEDLEKMASMKRSRPNFEKIQEQLTELREMSDNASEVLSAVDSSRDTLQELSDALDGTSDDNPLLGDVSALRDQVTDLLAALPGDDSSIGELVDEAESAAEDYEQSLDDSDYDREDREELFDSLCNAMGNIASAIS